MAVSTIDPNGLNIGQIGGTRNKIINGAMVIDQRNAGSAVTVNNTNLNYGVDRWWGTGRSADGVYTLQRSTTTPPSGFSHFLRATVTTADASIASTDTYYMGTKIEGFNVSDLGFGSASAKTITISFVVRSSVTGTFSGALLNGAENRSYPFTFAVSSADTWETKSVTIAGDTAGTWATDNSAGMLLSFDLGNGTNFRAAAGSWNASGKYGVTGAVTLISTLNATFDITGVQLEAGDTATPFEHRSYGQELALCERYYLRQQGSTLYPFFCTGYLNSATRMFGIFNFPQKMRATPTLETGTVSNYQILSVTASPTCTGISLDGQTTNFSAFLVIDAGAGGMTTGQGSIFRGNNTASAFVAYSAEL
jgi:hypothetical protein